MILDDPEWIKLDPRSAQAVKYGKFVIVLQRENAFSNFGPFFSPLARSM